MEAWNSPGIHDDQMAHQDLRPRDNSAIWRRAGIFPARCAFCSGEYPQTSFFDSLGFDDVILSFIQSFWIDFKFFLLGHFDGVD